MTSLDQIESRMQLCHGLSLEQLHHMIYQTKPESIGKGWTGRLLEQWLGVTNLNESTPDLPEIGLEIKTLPVSHKGRVLEHTFLATIPFPFREGSFRRSRLYNKIQKILWIPIVRKEKRMSFQDQIGAAFIQDLEKDSEVLSKLTEDWDLLAGLLREESYRLISSEVGDILHIRPKAQNAAQKIWVGEQKINPMGFYFRKNYTQELIDKNLFTKTIGHSI